MKHPRTSIAALSLSASALVSLFVAEGWFETAAIPVKGDVPTVGPGLTKRPDGSSVQMGDTIKPVEGVQRSYAHVAKDETKLKQCVTAPLAQVEYDTLALHAYQYGSAVTCASQVVKLTNQGRYAEACQAYLNFRYITDDRSHAGWEPYKFGTTGQPIRWRYDCTTPGNKVCAGVGKRSLERRDRCLAAGDE